MQILLELKVTILSAAVGDVLVNHFPFSPVTALAARAERLMAVYAT